MFKRLFFTLLLALPALVSAAQSDFDLTQRWFNESLYNPAAVGNSFSSGFFLHGRQQWAGLAKAPTTFAGTFDTYVKDWKSGFGITAMTDKIGLSKSTNVRFAYAYYILVGDESVLSLGLSAGVLMNSRTASGAVIDDPMDPELAYADYKKTSPDFDFGLEYKGPLKFGVAVRHIISQSGTDNIPKQSMNVWAYASSRFNVSEPISIEPLLSLAYRDNVYRGEGGALLYFGKTKDTNIYNDRFWVGGVYRTGGGYAAMAGLHISPQLRLGYSFDHGTGSLGTLANKGSHEIFLAFQFDRIFYKELDCPAYRTSVNPYRGNSRGKNFR